MCPLTEPCPCMSDVGGGAAAVYTQCRVLFRAVDKQDRVMVLGCRTVIRLSIPCSRHTRPYGAWHSGIRHDFLCTRLKRTESRTEVTDIDTRDNMQVAPLARLYRWHCSSLRLHASRGSRLPSTACGLASPVRSTQRCGHGCHCVRVGVPVHRASLSSQRDGVSAGKLKTRSPLSLTPPRASLEPYEEGRAGATQPKPLWVTPSFLYNHSTVLLVGWLEWSACTLG